MMPLFIPLKTEYYRAFESGAKRHEYRRYGPLWNERHCAPGREVKLRRGYSTPDVMRGVVVGFRRITPADLSPVALEAWRACYGPDAGDIAEIEIGGLKF
jgi:hypothetical protein